MPGRIFGMSLGSSGGTPGEGTVTSVALSMPTGVFDVSGSPITDSGTLTVAFDNQTANTVFAGPDSGAAAAPAFRALVDDDMPVVSISKGGTGQTTAQAAIDALLPTQTGNSGKFLTTDGTNSSWDTVSGAGVDTLAAIGSSPNANAATISGTTLNLEPASASFGGVVTTGTQSFAGAKTFGTPATVFTVTNSFTTAGGQVNMIGSLAASAAVNQSALLIAGDSAGSTPMSMATGSANVVRQGQKIYVTGTFGSSGQAAGLYVDSRATLPSKDFSLDRVNMGGYFYVDSANTSGANIAVRGWALGSNLNIAGNFQAQSAGGTTPINVAVAAKAAQTSTAQCNPLFAKAYATADGTNLTNAAPGQAAVGLFDNGNTTIDGLVVQDGGTNMFVVADGGVVTLGATSTTPQHILNTATQAAGSDVMTLTNGPAGTAGDPDLFVKITINGSTYVIPAWTPT